mmetsp:Transcript_96306/g.272273  ORF Transcript_96306/g.272273 Transcript_96306/m.272273 type:complete len:224 (-) Transcript_96306:1150-1821(-)
MISSSANQLTILRSRCAISSSEASSSGFGSSSGNKSNACQSCTTAAMTTGFFFWTRKGNFSNTRQFLFTISMMSDSSILGSLSNSPTNSALSNSSGATYFIERLSCCKWADIAMGFLKYPGDAKSRARKSWSKAKETTSWLLLISSLANSRARQFCLTAAMTTSMSACNSSEASSRNSPFLRNATRTTSLFESKLGSRIFSASASCETPAIATLAFVRISCGK